MDTIEKMDEIRISLLQKIIAAGKLNEISFKFKVMNNDQCRVTTALMALDMFKIVPPYLGKLKNDKVSIDFRDQANRIYIKGKNNVDQLIISWELYSKSIANAANDSEQLAIAYANRSAVLFNLKKYKDCNIDISEALSLSYPSHLIPKLLSRKIESLSLDNEVNHQNIEREIANIKAHQFIDENEREKIESKLKILKDATKENVILENKTRILPKIVPNKEYPSSSEALTVKYNDKFGRQVIANRKIEIGEVLVVEKSYAQLLAPEESFTHCANCLQVCWSMIPCKSCVYVMYCSESCRKKVWNECHDIECKIIGHLIELGFNRRTLLSLRLVIIAVRELGSIENLKKEVEKIEKVTDPLKKGFTDNGIYDSNTYRSFYTLVTNTEKRSMHDLFERALNAAFIVFYLYTCTNFFGKQFQPDLTEMIANCDVTFIGGLILRHQQLIPSNAHSYEEDRKIDSVGIGTSALPFCSLINHSCDPNVSRSSTISHKIIFSILPIEKGSQIFDNYGAHYAVMTKSERIQKLQQYYFNCDCRACRNDWPLYHDLKSYTQLLLNKNLRDKITKSLVKLPTYVDMLMLQSTVEGFIDSNPHIYKDLLEMLNILLKYVNLPCYEVNNVTETFKKVFALTYGNVFYIPKL